MSSPNERIFPFVSVIMKILASLLFVVTVFAHVGCNRMVSVRVGKGPSIAGSGNVVQEERRVDPFSKIEFRGAGTLSICQGEKQSVSIKTDDNLLTVIDTVVTDGKLTIKPNNDLSNFTLSLEVVVTNIDELEISGVGTMNLDSIEAEDLTVTISGAATIVGNGKVKNLTVKSSGASKLNTKDLVAQSVVINVSGASTATVHATEKFDAKISGVGKITCYGSPKIVDKSVKGAGTVTVMDSLAVIR